MGKGFLIVGGDSLVGGALLGALARRGHTVFGSTRRRDTMTANRVYLNVTASASFRAPEGVDYAFLVAATTNYGRCETDPTASQVNVEAIPRLAVHLLEQGLFVTFISTNTVFGGERPWPNEDDLHAPGIAYARQKSEGERVIRAAAERLGAADRMNIVRLTKILAVDTSPLPDWFAAFERGEKVRPFADLIFAPLSLRFTAESLASIGEKRVPGNLHLSGAANVSYVDLAHGLVDALDVPRSQVSPTTSAAMGVKVLFAPRYSGLGMARTTVFTGIGPEPLDAVVGYLVSEHRRTANSAAKLR